MSDESSIHPTLQQRLATKVWDWRYRWFLAMDRHRLSRGAGLLPGAVAEEDLADDEPFAFRLKAYGLTQENWRGVIEQDRDHRERCSAFPESLQMELTKACNFRCPHCGTHGTSDVHARSNKAMPMEISLLDRLAEQIFPSCRRVSLVGEGEPFAAPRSLLSSLFDHLDRTHTFLEVSTNGALLDPALIEAMLPILSHITLSLDAASSHMFRKVRRSEKFAKILQSLRRLATWRDEAPMSRRFQISLSFTLMRENVSELVDFLRMAAAWGADAVYVRHLLVHFRELKCQSLLGEPNLANPALERAAEEAERLGLSVFLPDLIASDPIQDAPPPDAPASPAPPARVHCSFLWRSLAICATGDVFPCCGLSPPLLGNLTKQGFDEIWNGETLREMRRRLDTPDPHPTCAHCWFREISYFDSPATQEDFTLRGTRKPHEKRYDPTAFVSQRAQSLD